MKIEINDIKAMYSGATVYNSATTEFTKDIHIIYKDGTKDTIRLMSSAGGDLVDWGDTITMTESFLFTLENSDSLEKAISEIEFDLESYEEKLKKIKGE